MISAPIDTLDTANRLRPALLRLARELRRETETLGITSRQATLLSLIQEHPGLSLRELAALERISAPSLSGHIDRLERAMLIERVRSGGDRRRVGLELTTAGDGLLRKIRAQRTTWLAERLAELAPEQIAAIEGAIEPLSSLLSLGHA
jgi:DNA-binding MarR family transcriptional regulator